MKFVALLFFAGVASAQEPPRTFRVPFHTVDKMILLDVLIDEKAAVLLLDTGAHVTVISPRLAKDATCRRPTSLQGVNGITRVQEARVTVTIGEEKLLLYAFVSEMDSMSQGLHVKIDGVLGMDVLGSYSGMRFWVMTGWSSKSKRSFQFTNHNVEHPAEIRYTWPLSRCRFCRRRQPP